MYLKQDLYDIYHNKLVNKDQEITDGLVTQLIARAEKLPKKLIPIKDTPILKDIHKVFKDKRYTKIFSSKKTRETIIKTLNKLKLEEPLVLELKNMKKYLPYTYKHVLIIAALTITIATSIPRSKYNPLLAAHLSLTHDIGKTRIPKRILNKKTELTKEEYHTIHIHPLIGYLLLNYYYGWEGKKYCWTAYEHHEKLNGSGYPRALKKIDLYAQLITPIDIFDALTSDRPYRGTPFSMRLGVDFLLDGVRSGRLNKENVYSLINCFRKHKVFPVPAMKVSQKKRSKPPTDSVYGKYKKVTNWLKRD